MERIPFSPDEMTPRYVEPGFPGCAERAIFQTPVSLKENLVAAVRDKRCWFMPNVLDVQHYDPRIIPDNLARGEVWDGGEPFTPDPDGEQDVFGVTWLYDPVVRGSMVRPGAPLLEDIEDWKDVIVFPDVDSWDWDAQAELDKDYFTAEGYAYMATVFTGFFERLISWMDFEEAAIAMIDEESKPYVHELFDKLADLYISYIDHITAYAPIDGFELHDDWGSQKSTFMAVETVREMVLPYLKRVVDHAHEKGLFFQLHSCGKIESLVPTMIDAGVDLWMGQSLNDKKALFDRFGDKIMFEVELPAVGAQATREEVWEAAQQFADDFIVDGKPCAISIYSVVPEVPAAFTDAIYEISRQRYCG